MSEPGRGSNDEARARWTQKMKTDPLFRRQKLVHWQQQIDFAQRRGWPAPENAVGGIRYYGRLHDEWKRERQAADPEGFARENHTIERQVAEMAQRAEVRQAELDAQLDAAAEAARRKVLARGDHRPDPTVGLVDGRKTSEFVGEVKALMKIGREDEAEELLLRLVDAVEAEARENDWGVAPWYYERLAVLYSKRGDVTSEIDVLERFARRQHAPGEGPAKLLDRLEKARRKLG